MTVPTCGVWFIHAIQETQLWCAWCAQKQKIRQLGMERKTSPKMFTKAVKLKNAPAGNRTNDLCQNHNQKSSNLHFFPLHQNQKENLRNQYCIYIKNKVEKEIKGSLFIHYCRITLRCSSSNSKSYPS